MSQSSEAILVLNSSRFGQGNPRLGELLMKDFLEALSLSEAAPAAALLYNSAVVLACKDSPVLEQLQALEKGGCAILVNQESLAFYSLEDSLSVGTKTDIAAMTDRMLKADLVLKP